MKVHRLTILFSLISVSPLLQSQPTESARVVATEPGAGKAVQTVRTTASVVGIIPDTRTVSLKRADGKIVEIRAGEEVRNFDMIKIGDTVTAEYTQALSLELKKGGGGLRERNEVTAMTRAPVGAQPSGTVERTVSVLADVVKVDSKARQITLRDPNGKLVDLAVHDADQLNRVKQGDQVQALYREAIAIAVQPAPSTSGK
jgi:hypothetical protein